MPPPPQPPPPVQPPSFFSTVLNPSSTSTSASTPNTASTSTSRAAAAPATAQQQATSFTATQRSQQARAKPYDTASAGETYETQRKRAQAAAILGSVELLLWCSGARNESLSQTRQHYQNIVLGLEDDNDGEGGEEVMWKEEWEVPVEQRVRGAGADEDVEMGDGGGRASPAMSAGGSTSKGKERVRRTA